MCVRVIALAAALLFGLGACAGGMSSGMPQNGANHSGGGNTGGMGGGGGGGGY